MNFSRLMNYTAVCLMVFASATVHADALDNIKKAKKIRIGIELTGPPYGMTDEKLQPAGSDVDTARLLAKDLGVDLEIVTVTGQTRIPYLQTNKTDLAIATLSISPERARAIDFSVPYSNNQTVIVAVKGVDLKGYPDLAGKSVAVTRGNVQEAEIMKHAPDANLVRYDDNAALITAAISGQADILGTTSMMLYTLKRKAPERQMENKFIIKNFSLGIGVRKNEPKLLAWVNDWIKTNLKNGKLNEIYKKHHGMDLPPEMIAEALK